MQQQAQGHIAKSDQVAWLHVGPGQVGRLVQDWGSGEAKAVGGAGVQLVVVGMCHMGHRGRNNPIHVRTWWRLLAGLYRPQHKQRHM
jgi:hypothetical protein